MRRKAKKSKLFLILILVLGISIGYAALSKTLKINGTSGIKKGSWSIYFDRIQNEDGVVSSETKISLDKKEVNFNIAINTPGDYYEFEVDTVNDGSIDAMIESTELTGINDADKNTLLYDVTYDDGTDVKACDILQAGTRKKIKVRLEYNNDIDPEDLLDEQQLNIKFKINYVQNATCQDKVTLNIDPNGGKYKDIAKVVKVNLEKNTVYASIDTPRKSGYVFQGWEKEDGTLLEKDETTNYYKVSIGTTNLTVTARWTQDLTDYVARINDDYYETIQSAIDHAVADDEIHLLKSTTESPMNNKKVVLNLEGFTVTGTLTNTSTGDIVLKNGKFTSNSVTVVNNGTFTLGVKDGDYQINDIIIEGETKGLEQNNNFYFYDGYIQALDGIDGGCNGKEDGYYIYADEIKINEVVYQKVYLTDHPTGVAMTINGEEFYFKSLQYAVAATDNQHPTVYIIADFESSAAVTVANNQILILDMNGHTLEYGAQLTNNGTLTVTDSQTTKGNFRISLPIINNNSLTVDDVVITQTTTNGNVIENNSNMSITKATLTAVSGNVIYNTNAGTITLDNDSVFTTNGYVINNNASGTTNLTGGHIASINQQQGTLVVTNITMNSTKDGAINQTGGTLNIKSGTYQTTGEKLINKSAGDLIIDNGTFTSNVRSSYGVIRIIGGTTTINNGSFSYNYNGYGSLFYIYDEILNIKNGTFQADHGIVLNINSSTTTTIDGGTFSSQDYSITNTSYPITINGGTFTSVNDTAIKLYGTTTITGGTFTSTDGYALNGGGNSRNTIQTITGGTFTSLNETAALFNSSRTDAIVNIEGGTFIGKKYGINVTYNNSVRIGANGENLDLTKPVVEGELIGLYVGNDKVSFYDGILKGKTKAYEGTIATIRSNHYIATGSETKPNSDVYETAYLQLQPNFVMTNDGREFNNLQTAITHIRENLSNTGTLTLTSDIDYKEDVTIPSGTTVTLELDGYTINTTKQITNKGTLTIKNRKSTGMMTSIADRMIYNDSTGTLNITNGTFQGKTLFHNYSGIINVTDATVTNTDKFIYQYNGTVTIDDCDVTTSTNRNIEQSGGTLTINGGTINNTGNSDGIIYIGSSTSTVINDINITTATQTAIFNGGGSNLTINGGTITATSTAYALRNSGTATITGGTLTSTNYEAIRDAGTLFVSGGTIESTLAEGIYIWSDSSHHYTATITGGTVKGKTNGVTVTAYAKLTLGDKSNAIDTTTPVIIGEDYGVSVANGGALDFYDGILKGKTKGYDGIVNDLPLNSLVEEGTEVISSETYKTAYVSNQQNFAITNDGEEFSSIQDAIDHIEDTSSNKTGSITLYRSVSSTDPVEVKSTLNITLDFAGNTYNTTKPIVNKGTLKITDGNQTVGGIVNNRTSIINTSGNLTIEKGNYVGQEYLINQTTGTMQIDGGTFTNSSAKTLSIYKTGGTTTINGGSFNATATSSVNAIRSTTYLSGGTTTITGGTFTSTFYNSLITSNETVTINGGTFNSNYTSQSYDRVSIEGGSTAYIYGGTFEGEKYSGLNNHNSTTTVYGGTFTMNNSNATTATGAISNSGNGTLTINGGTFTGVKYGMSNAGTATILGGEFVGNQYGVYENGGTLEIGNDNSIIDVSSPILQGGTHGLYINKGTVRFYDGILKGKTAGYTGTISKLATDSQIKTDEEEIDNETYYTAYLITQKYIVRNERIPRDYKEFSEALSEAQTNDTLLFIENGSNYNEITIPNKNLTIDLAGHTLTTSKAITNQGTTIIKSTGSKGTITTGASLVLMTNDSDLTLNNINLYSTNTENDIVLNKIGKTLTTNDSELISSKGSMKNLGTLNLNTTNVTLKGTFTNDTALLQTLNSNITGDYQTLYNYNAELQVNGGTITSARGDTIVFSGTSAFTQPDSEIKNANVTSTANGTGIEVIDNDFAKLTLTNTNTSTTYVTSNCLTNKATLNINGGTISNGIKNTGTMNIQNAALESYIENTSNMTITNTDLDINIIDAYQRSSKMNYNIIDNSGTLTATTFDITTTSNYYNYNFRGIYNTGTLTYNSGNIAVNKGYTNYGIYNAGGTFTMLGGTIVVGDATNANGVYQTSGEMIFGHLEGTGQAANPSTTNPSVKAVGTSSGYGVRKLDGYFRYFDGKFTGSTLAKPEAPTQIEEPDYEVTTGTDLDGYNYCILTYLEQH